MDLGHREDNSKFTVGLDINEVLTLALEGLQCLLQYRIAAFRFTAGNEKKGGAPNEELPEKNGSTTATSPKEFSDLCHRPHLDTIIKREAQSAAKSSQNPRENLQNEAKSSGNEYREGEMFQISDANMASIRFRSEDASSSSAYKATANASSAKGASIRKATSRPTAGALENSFLGSSGIRSFSPYAGSRSVEDENGSSLAFDEMAKTINLPCDPSLVSLLVEKGFDTNDQIDKGLAILQAAFITGPRQSGEGSGSVRSAGGGVSDEEFVFFIAPAITISKEESINRALAAQLDTSVCGYINWADFSSFFTRWELYSESVKVARAEFLYSQKSALGFGIKHRSPVTCVALTRVQPSSASPFAGECNDFDFTANGALDRFCLTGDADGAIIMWDTATLNSIQTIQGIGGVEFRTNLTTEFLGDELAGTTYHAAVQSRGKNWVRDLCFIKSGKLAVAQSPNLITLYNVNPQQSTLSRRFRIGKGTNRSLVPNLSPFEVLMSTAHPGDCTALCLPRGLYKEANNSETARSETTKRRASVPSSPLENALAMSSLSLLDFLVVGMESGAVELYDVSGSYRASALENVPSSALGNSLRREQVSPRHPQNDNEKPNQGLDSLSRAITPILSYHPRQSEFIGKRGGRAPRILQIVDDPIQRKLGVLRDCSPYGASRLLFLDYETFRPQSDHLPNARSSGTQASDVSFDEALFKSPRADWQSTPPRMARKHSARPPHAHNGVSCVLGLPLPCPIKNTFVNKIHYDPASQLVLGISHSRVACVYSTVMGNVVSTFSDHTSAIVGGAIIPSRNTAYIATDDRSIHMYDIRTSRKISMTSLNSSIPRQFGENFTAFAFDYAKERAMGISYFPAALCEVEDGRTADHRPQQQSDSGPTHSGLSVGGEQIVGNYERDKTRSEMLSPSSCGKTLSSIISVSVPTFDSAKQTQADDTSSGLLSSRDANLIFAEGNALTMRPISCVLRTFLRNVVKDAETTSRKCLSGDESGEKSGGKNTDRIHISPKPEKVEEIEPTIALKANKLVTVAGATILRKDNESPSVVKSVEEENELAENQRKEQLRKEQLVSTIPGPIVDTLALGAASGVQMDSVPLARTSADTATRQAPTRDLDPSTPSPLADPPQHQQLKTINSDDQTAARLEEQRALRIRNPLYLFPRAPFSKFCFRTDCGQIKYLVLDRNNKRVAAVYSHCRVDIVSTVTFTLLGTIDIEPASNDVASRAKEVNVFGKETKEERRLRMKKTASNIKGSLEVTEGRVADKAGRYGDDDIACLEFAHTRTGAQLIVIGTTHGIFKIFQQHEGEISEIFTDIFSCSIASVVHVGGSPLGQRSVSMGFRHSERILVGLRVGEIYEYELNFFRRRRLIDFESLHGGLNYQIRSSSRSKELLGTDKTAAVVPSNASEASEPHARKNETRVSESRAFGRPSQNPAESLEFSENDETNLKDVPEAERAPIRQEPSQDFEYQIQSKHQQLYDAYQKQNRELDGEFSKFRHTSHTKISQSVEFIKLLDENHVAALYGSGLVCIFRISEIEINPVMSFPALQTSPRYPLEGDGTSTPSDNAASAMAYYSEGGEHLLAIGDLSGTIYLFDLTPYFSKLKQQASTVRAESERLPTASNAGPIPFFYTCRVEASAVPTASPSPTKKLSILDLYRLVTYIGVLRALPNIAVSDIAFSSAAAASSSESDSCEGSILKNSGESFSLSDTTSLFQTKFVPPTLLAMSALSPASNKPITQLNLSPRNRRGGENPPLQRTNKARNGGEASLSPSSVQHIHYQMVVSSSESMTVMVFAMPFAVPIYIFSHPSHLKDSELLKPYSDCVADIQAFGKANLLNEFYGIFDACYHLESTHRVYSDTVSEKERLVLDLIAAASSEVESESQSLETMPKNALTCGSGGGGSRSQSPLKAAVLTLRAQTAERAGRRPAELSLSATNSPLVKASGHFSGFNPLLDTMANREEPKSLMAMIAAIGPKRLVADGIARVRTLSTPTLNNQSSLDFESDVSRDAKNSHSLRNTMIMGKSWLFAAEQPFEMILRTVDLELGTTSILDSTSTRCADLSPKKGAHMANFFNVISAPTRPSEQSQTANVLTLLNPNKIRHCSSVLQAQQLFKPATVDRSICDNDEIKERISTFEAPALFTSVISPSQDTANDFHPFYGALIYEIRLSRKQRLKSQLKDTFSAVSAFTTASGAFTKLLSSVTTGDKVHAPDGVVKSSNIPQSDSSNTIAVNSLRTDLGEVSPPKHAPVGTLTLDYLDRSLTETGLKVSKSTVSARKPHAFLSRTGAINASPRQSSRPSSASAAGSKIEFRETKIEKHLDDSENAGGTFVTSDYRSAGINPDNTSHEQVLGKQTVTHSSLSSKSPRHSSVIYGSELTDAIPIEVIVAPDGLGNITPRRLVPSRPASACNYVRKHNESSLASKRPLTASTSRPSRSPPRPSEAEKVQKTHAIFSHKIPKPPPPPPQTMALSTAPSTETMFEKVDSTVSIMTSSASAATFDQRTKIDPKRVNDDCDSPENVGIDNDDGVGLADCQGGTKDGYVPSPRRKSEASKPTETFRRSSLGIFLIQNNSRDVQRKLKNILTSTTSDKFSDKSADGGYRSRSSRKSPTSQTTNGDVVERLYPFSTKSNKDEPYDKLSSDSANQYESISTLIADFRCVNASDVNGNHSPILPFPPPSTIEENRGKQLTKNSVESKHQLANNKPCVQSSPNTSRMGPYPPSKVKSSNPPDEPLIISGTNTSSARMCSAASPRRNGGGMCFGTNASHFRPSPRRESFLPNNLDIVGEGTRLRSESLNDVALSQLSLREQRQIILDRENKKNAMDHAHIRITGDPQPFVRDRFKKTQTNQIYSRIVPANIPVDELTKAPFSRKPRTVRR